MKLNLHPIQNDHATLASLAQFYLYELSEIENLDICDNGRFEHDILHGTAVRSDLLPFVIYAAEQLIGFVLISQHSRMRSHFLVILLRQSLFYAATAGMAWGGAVSVRFLIAFLVYGKSPLMVRMSEAWPSGAV